MQGKILEKWYELTTQIGNRRICVLVKNVKYGTNGIMHAVKVGEEDKFSVSSRTVFTSCQNAEIAVRGDFYLEEYQGRKDNIE